MLVSSSSASKLQGLQWLNRPESGPFGSAYPLTLTTGINNAGGCWPLPSPLAAIYKTKPGGVCRGRPLPASTVTSRCVRPRRLGRRQIIAAQRKAPVCMYCTDTVCAAGRLVLASTTSQRVKASRVRERSTFTYHFGLLVEWRLPASAWLTLTVRC